MDEIGIAQAVKVEEIRQQIDANLPASLKERVRVEVIGHRRGLTKVRLYAILRDDGDREGADPVS